MPLFRRRPTGEPDSGPVTAFWAWWTAEGRDLAERSIAGEVGADELAPAITERVHALGPLAWELAAGQASAHVLVITAEGDPELRGLARRVVLAAPEADATWSYVDTRPPAPDPEGTVLRSADGGEIDFARVQVSARREGSRFAVQVHHPAYADLPAEARTQVTFLALDAALGEVDTELWLGQVDAAEVPPLDGFGLAALRAVVEDHKRQHQDQDGAPAWMLLRGETSEGPLVAAARIPLHPLTAPHLDTHVSLVLPYADRTEEGLPTGESLDRLQQLEDRLDRTVGVRGAVVAHESTAGLRTIHLYLDSTAHLLPAVKQVLRTWPEGKGHLHDMPDPGWVAVRHLAG